MLILNTIPIKKSLSKLLLKTALTKGEVSNFAKYLKTCFYQIRNEEREEYIKNIVADFLKHTLYAEYYLNTSKGYDLVVFQDKTSDKIEVIFEFKSIRNRNEMISIDAINKKALHELVYYFLQERIDEKNDSLKHLIITNFEEWFIFNAQHFEEIFLKPLKTDYTEFKAGKKSYTTQADFYNQVIKPYIQNTDTSLPCTYFSMQTIQDILDNETDEESLKKLIPFFKILSPEHLLKKTIYQDNNILDEGFYKEILHIIGIEEVEENNRILIKRQKYPNRGSIIENTIEQLRITKKHEKFSSDTNDETLFELALELCLLWINRIIFLKLLEAQLVLFHKDKQHRFLNTSNIKTFHDLNDLFFNILSVKKEDRPENHPFYHLPYLNSALFEVNEIEKETISIGCLNSALKIPFYSQTILQDHNGKRQKGECHTLEYLLNFLDSYNFGLEDADELTQEKHTLISASVLGLLFEKINGYKEGSVFTPSFITMYMTQKGIQHAVVNLFNKRKNWTCQNFDELKECIHNEIKNSTNKVATRQELNSIFNNIKIGDPAVGSGHFLVSALNELIKAKYDLNILIDSNGQPLSCVQIDIENDELHITDLDGNLFLYHPKNAPSQNVQQTIFNEKKKLIEECLFGTDINKNSVNICRLRLWIELLKHAYYNNKNELTTLPNIDINIKHGNSLISIFPLNNTPVINGNNPHQLKRIEQQTKEYKQLVQYYKDTDDKTFRDQLLQKIKNTKQDLLNTLSLMPTDELLLKIKETKARLFQKNNSIIFTDYSEREKTEKELKELSQQLSALEAEYKDRYQLSFEWRFEFPEILTNDARFEGFDLIIGNPPYINIEEISPQIKEYAKQHYTFAHKKYDLYVLFYERAFQLLKPNGILNFITSNKFLSQDYGLKLREHLLQNKIIEIVNFNCDVFAKVNVDTCIILAEKTPIQTTHHKIRVLNFNSLKEAEQIQKLQNEKSFLINQNIFNTLADKKFRLHITPEKISILNKTEEQTLLLKEICSVNYGLRPTPKEKQNENLHSKNQFIHDSIKKSVKQLNYKPYFEGKDTGKWTIKTHRYIDYSHPEKFYNPMFPELFENEKLCGLCTLSDIHKLRFIYDNQKMYTNHSIAVVTLWHKLKNVQHPTIKKTISKNKINTSKKYHYFYLQAILNSTLIKFYVNELLYDGVHFYPNHIKQLPIKQISSHNADLAKKIIQLVKKLHTTTHQQQSEESKEVKNLEQQIDNLVFQLYNISEQEKNIICQTLKHAPSN